MLDAPQPAVEATIPLKSPIAGVIEQVSISEARKLTKEGWTPATPEEVRAEALEAEYGGLGGGMLASAAALGRGATFGGTDVLLSQLGYGEELAKYQKASPSLSTGFEIGGSLLGLGKFAAPGALAKGARVLSAPTRALWKGGAKLEKMVGGGVKGAAARGGLEGGVISAGQMVSEDALGKEDLTAESLAMGVGYGALLGGGLGGALSGAGKALGYGGHKLQSVVGGEAGIEGLLQKTFGYAGRGVAKAMAAGAKLTGRPGAEFVEEAVTSAAKRRSMTMGRELIAEEVPGFFKRFLGFTERNNLAGAKFKGLAKEGEIKLRLDPARAQEQMVSARRMVNHFRAELDDMLGNKLTYSPTKIKGTKGLEASVVQAEGALAELEELARRVVGRTGRPFGEASEPLMAKMYTALDALKRGSGKSAKFYRGKAGRLANEDMTFGKLKALYQHGRDELEKVGTWGDAGILQKVTNGTWTPAIQGDDASGFARFWLKPHKPAGAFADDVWLPTQKQVDGVFGNVTNPTGDEAVNAMRGHLKTHVAHNEMIAKRLKNLSPSQRKWLRESRDEANALLSTLDEVAEHATSVNQMKVLEGGSDATGLVGGLVGFGLAGGSPVALAAGAVAGPILNPARGIRQLAAVDRIVSGVRDKIPGASGKMRAAAKAARPVVVRSTLVARDRRRKEKAADAALQAKGGDVRGEVRTNLAPIIAGAPDTVDAAAEVAQKGVDYLAEHAPAPRQRFGALGAVPIPPSDEELERFDRRRRAVDNPRTIIEDIENGMVSREAVDAVQTVYPAYYKALCKQLTDDMESLTAKGLMIPYPEARVVSVVLGQPVDVLDHPRVAEAIQATYHEPDPEPPKGPGRSKPGAKGEAPDFGQRLRGNDDLEDL